MHNIVILSGSDITYLRAVLDTAVENEQDVSLNIHPGVYGGLQAKRGESTWTYPFGEVTL